jgi:hypothetical protein
MPPCIYTISFLFFLVYCLGEIAVQTYSIEASDRDRIYNSPVFIPRLGKGREDLNSHVISVIFFLIFTFGDGELSPPRVVSDSAIQHGFTFTHTALKITEPSLQPHLSSIQDI